MKDFKQSAMHFIGSGFQVYVHDAARCASVLRTGAIGDNLHLPDRFDGRPNHKGCLIDKVDDVDVVVNTIQQKVVFAC